MCQCSSACWGISLNSRSEPGCRSRSRSKLHPPIPSFALCQLSATATFHPHHKPPSSICNSVQCLEHYAFFHNSGFLFRSRHQPTIFNSNSLYSALSSSIPLASSDYSQNNTYLDSLTFSSSLPTPPSRNASDAHIDLSTACSSSLSKKLHGAQPTELVYNFSLPECMDNAIYLAQKSLAEALCESENNVNILHPIHDLHNYHHHHHHHHHSNQPTTNNHAETDHLNNSMRFCIRLPLDDGSAMRLHRPTFHPFSQISDEDRLQKSLLKKDVLLAEALPHFLAVYAGARIKVIVPDRDIFIEIGNQWTDWCTSVESIKRAAATLDDPNDRITLESTPTDTNLNIATNTSTIKTQRRHRSLDYDLILIVGAQKPDKGYLRRIVSICPDHVPLVLLNCFEDIGAPYQIEIQPLVNNNQNTPKTRNSPSSSISIQNETLVFRSVFYCKLLLYGAVYKPTLSGLWNIYAGVDYGRLEWVTNSQLDWAPTQNNLNNLFLQLGLDRDPTSGYFKQTNMDRDLCWWPTLRVAFPDVQPIIPGISPLC